MPSSKSVEAIIEQFSHAVGIPGLSLDEHGMITLRAGDDLLVHLAYDDTSDQMILSTAVHPDAGELSTTALRRMLATNVKLHAEAGPSFAIAPGAGEVVLEQYLTGSKLDYGHFEEVWIRFLDQAERAQRNLTLLTSTEPPLTTEVEPVASDQLFVFRA